MRTCCAKPEWRSTYDRSRSNCFGVAKGHLVRVSARSLYLPDEI